MLFYLITLKARSAVDLIDKQPLRLIEIYTLIVLECKGKMFSVNLIRNNLLSFAFS